MTTPPRRSPPVRGRARAGLRTLAHMVNIHEWSPDPSSISADTWWRLESATLLSVTHKIQPTVSSQHLRARVIDYLQRLFRLHHDSCQVIPFGSVPFKTYLPDGDIDLTLLDTAISDENLENEVCTILKSEEQRKDSEFEVKDVKYVPAEVKLVKCKVQNIAVDISVNQIGGPNKLYFLEKILVLYVYHIFHKSLDGPLAVLYRFLDYYSKFDWDNKGISLFGPISLSSLPELVTEPLDTRDYGFVARETFLKDCAQAFSIPPRNSEKSPEVFSKKHVNIVDPLKQNNNLGRSVSKGNYVRIRRELYNGACKLGKILQAPTCFYVNEINRFFSNTLKRADVLLSSSDDVPLTANVTNDSVSPDSDVERINKSSSPNNSCDVLFNQFNYMKISDSKAKQKECDSMAEYKGIKSVSWGLPDSDATSDTTTDSVSISNGGDFSDVSPSPSETCTPQSRDHCVQHLLFQSENGKKVDVRDSTKHHKEFSRSSSPQLWHNNARSFLTGLVDDRATSNSILTPKISRWAGTTNNIVSDLAGGSDINFHNLLYARGFQQDSPSNQLYNYPMLAPGPGPLHQTDDHMAMRAHGTATYFPYSNLLVGKPHANTPANDHGTTAVAAPTPSQPASSSSSSTARQRQTPPAPEPAASLPPPSASPSFDSPGGARECPDQGLEGNAGGGSVGIRGDAADGAEGIAAPVASSHSKARKRRPRARGRR